MFVPFPRKMTRGLIRGSPSANNVICTVHCLLSSPEALPTLFSPPFQYKGRGV